MNRNERAVAQRERHIAHRLRSIYFDACRLQDHVLAPLDERLHQVYLELNNPTNELSDSTTTVSVPPLVRYYSNLRCGDWYLPSHSFYRTYARQEYNERSLQHPSLIEKAPQPTSSSSLTSSTTTPSTAAQQQTSCYFKSADGHYGRWTLNRQRLNLDLLLPLLRNEAQKVVSTSSGDVMPEVVVVVDATQHGKRFPDAFSSTVPMWAATCNAALWKGETSCNSTTARTTVNTELAFLLGYKRTSEMPFKSECQIGWKWFIGSTASCGKRRGAAFLTARLCVAARGRLCGSTFAASGRLDCQTVAATIASSDFNDLC